MRKASFGVIGTCLLLVGVPAGAAVIYDSAGFESPTFVTGALSGQDSWSATDPFTIVDNPAEAHAGSQYVNVAGAPGSNGAARNFTDSVDATVQFDGWFFVNSGNQWDDIQLRSSATGNPTFAAFGFLNGQPDVPGFSTDFVYRDQVGPGGGGVGTGGYIRLAEYTPDTWHHVQSTMDTVNGTYDVYFDGVLVGDDLLRRQTAATSVGRITLSQEAEVTPGGYRFDDLVVGDPIPEPAAGLVGLAMLGLFGKRCRRA